MPNASTPPRLRPLRPADRAPIEALLHGTGKFPPAEIDVALELVDEALGANPDGYRFVVAELPADDTQPELHNRVVGYACWGLASMSDGVHDLYWIAVDATVQGRGVGRALLAAVEAEVAADGGRYVLIETEGSADYDATRGFYLAAGYAEIGRIPDFYRVGADKVLYGRRVGPSASPSDPAR